jgi:small subunit ribosomal protein S19e
LLLLRFVFYRWFLLLLSWNIFLQVAYYFLSAAVNSIKMAEEARGICVRDVKADAFISEYAEHLKNSDKFELPVWSDTVKTGCFKELAPYGDDWYYIRAASIARKVYLRPGVGVGMLQKWYGGAYRRGARTEHFRKASAGIIRSVLIQLENMRVVEKMPNGGRRMTTVGQQDLDRIAGAVFEAGEDEE